MILRPERRKQQTVQSRLESLKKNDQVVTIGGIYGVVVNVNRESDEVTLKIDEATNAKMRVTIGAVARIVGEESADKSKLLGEELNSDGPVFAFCLAHRPAAPAVEAADKAATDAVTGDASATTLRLLIAIGIIIGSFVAGTIIANASCACRDFSFRIGLVLFTLFASLAIVYFGLATKTRHRPERRCGARLRELTPRPAVLTGCRTRFKRSIRKSTPAAASNWSPGRSENNRIEIVVPAGGNADAVQTTIENLRESGTILNLESRTKIRTARPCSCIGPILARKRPARHGRQLIVRGSAAGPIRAVSRSSPFASTAASSSKSSFPKWRRREIDQIKKKISTSGALNFRMVANPTDNRELIKPPAPSRTPRPRCDHRWPARGPLGEEPDPCPQGSLRTRRSIGPAGGRRSADPGRDRSV